MVTKDENVAAQVIERVFDNKMEYELENIEGYYKPQRRGLQAASSVYKPTQTVARVVLELLPMIEHNVGVNPTKLYELKEVSNDFFDEDEG